MAWSPDAAIETLEGINTLRRRTRQRAHGGSWVPAVVFAALLIASSSLYRNPFESPMSITLDYPFWAGLPDEQRAPMLSYLYWFIGLPVALALIGAWYRWRADRIGMRVPWRPFVVAGMTSLVLLAILAAMPGGPVSPESASRAWMGLVTPLLALSICVITFGWTERSVALIASGLWIGLLSIWLCSSFRLGQLPGWLADLLGGGSGPGLGGELALRPGHYMLVMAAPLAVFALVRGASAVLARVKGVKPELTRPA